MRVVSFQTLLSFLDCRGSVDVSEPTAKELNKTRLTTQGLNKSTLLRTNGLSAQPRLNCEDKKLSTARMPSEVQRPSLSSSTSLRLPPVTPFSSPSLMPATEMSTFGCGFAG